MLRATAAVLALLVAGCSSTPGDEANEGVASLSDFASCPWNGTSGVPDGCADEAVRIEDSGRPTLVGPCLDEIAGGGDFTLRVYRELQGVAIESATADGIDWQAIAVFAEAPTVAYAWIVGADTKWFLLPDAPTTGGLHVLFLTYNLTAEPATLAQGAEVRWAVEPYGVRPILVADAHYFDIGLFPREWPFVLQPSNLHLSGSDFWLRLEGVQNKGAMLELAGIPVNGIACAIPS